MAETITEENPEQVEVYPVSVKDVERKEDHLLSLFNEPKIIGLIGNNNEGKSNLVYGIIESLRQRYDFNIFTYGLKVKIEGTVEFKSIAEFENITNSLIVIEEVASLLDLEEKKAVKSSEKSLRLVFHNNNIILVSGNGENFKKFLSAKLHAVIFKKVDIDDMINGSKVKKIVMQYMGFERGSTVLNLKKGEAIVYDGNHYHKVDVPYLEKYDTKKENIPIFAQKG